MRKLILATVAVAGLAAGSSVFAQASNYDAATGAGGIPMTPYGYPADTVPGNAQRYGYGWTPGQVYGPNVYPDNYRYVPPLVAPGWSRNVDRDRDGRFDRDRDGRDDRRAGGRDRDGDGVRNRDDRYPDNPRRH